MPEIGEVARIVHYLRTHLLHRTIRHCEAFEDDIVYGKVATSASAFQTALKGRRVTNAAQQGKYFYLTFDKPPHAVMHLGMTGWMEFRGLDTKYYKQAKEDKERAGAQEWPPKYVKFLLKVGPEKSEAGKGEGKAEVEVAFVDARRLARIRLVDCKPEDIRSTTPLKENGPDPVIDKAVLTVAWLAELLSRKRVPVKALLLDQANISGVGNWVADEVLYQARIHPEQYSNTFDDEQIRRLHDSLIGVCTTAVETLADSTLFPDTWLMKYRWGKGKKDANVLPNGERIVHLKVGGRTSAIVPSVQRKTAAVAGDVERGAGAEVEGRQAKGRKRKARAESEEVEGEREVEDRPAGKKGGRGKKAKAEPDDEAEQQQSPQTRSNPLEVERPNPSPKTTQTETHQQAQHPPPHPRRRSPAMPKKKPQLDPAAHNPGQYHLANTPSPGKAPGHTNVRGPVQTVRRASKAKANDPRKVTKELGSGGW